MGGGPSRPKSTLSFDHILTRLQGELSDSLATANGLHGLTNALGNVGETLDGAGPPPTVLPSLPPAGSQVAGSGPAASSTSMSTQLSSASSSLELLNLHSELSDTRSSLASRAEKVRKLETVLTDHDSMKRSLRC